LDFVFLAVFFAVAPSTATYVFSCVLLKMIEVHSNQIAWPDSIEKARLKALTVEKHGPMCQGKMRVKETRFYYWKRNWIWFTA
jgi:hypothetical protein